MRNYFTTEALSEPCLRNLILAPIMGLLFVVFLPFVGYALVMVALTKHFAAKLSHPLAPLPMAAGNAYLTGRPNPDKVEHSDELKELADEIKERRK